MSYTIFAILVTIGFGIYFAVMIAMDVLGSKKVTKKNKQEVFNNTGMNDVPPEESSTVVNEVSENGGYQMGGSDYESGEGTSDDDSRYAPPVGGQSDDDDNQGSGDGSADNQGEEIPSPVDDDDNSATDPDVAQRPDDAYAQLEKVQNTQCQAVYPEYQSEYDSSSMDTYFSNNSVTSGRIQTSPINI